MAVPMMTVQLGDQRTRNTELDVVLMVAGRRRYRLVDYFAGRAAQLSYTLLLQVTFIYHVCCCYDLKPVSKASGAIHNTELQLKHAVKNIVCKAIMAMSIPKNTHLLKLRVSALNTVENVFKWTRSLQEKSIKLLNVYLHEALRHTADTVITQ